MLLPAFILLALGWLAWALPFFKKTPAPASPQKIDRRARWGIALQAIAYALLWQSQFWTHPAHALRLALSALCFLLAATFSWTSRFALGKQWRIDAALNADHQLIQSGPYRFIRHPIYTSMLCLLLATGLLITPWPLFLLAITLFLLGTEIRVRREESLLAHKFGDLFITYKHHTSAYLPFI